MHYPIFSSIVETIKTQLKKHGVPVNKNNTWDNSEINATGLELEIDLSNLSKYMNKLSINFDWDSFRERAMANQMVGMDTHPFLKMAHLDNIKVQPIIDVEVTWAFDVKSCQPILPDLSGNYRIDRAGEWMEMVSKRANLLLAKDDIITRWHIEIDGDSQGRYLSAINLISYFQHKLENLNNQEEVSTFVSRRLQELLLKSNRVISISDEILSSTIAA